MKRIFFTFFAIVMFGSMTMAQAKKDQRTLTTKIADLLARMPAKDSVALAGSMEQVADMGQKGLVGMAAMLAPPGKGDNTQAEYAINGFSYYVTQPGRENWRKMSEHALCQALTEAGDKVNKAFIISQLQIVAQSDEAVSGLKGYLSDDQLCDPAARALIKINTTVAKNALLKALSNSQGVCRLSIVKALGDSRLAASVPAITRLAGDNNIMLLKVVLRALADIANPSSASLLANAAEKSGYTFENTNATGSYLLYLHRLAENGNGNQAKKMLEVLMKTAKEDNQVHARIAAMSLLAGIQGKNNTQVLIDAAGNENPEYRVAALRLAERNSNSSTTSLWLNKLKQSNPETQADIIRMLGNSKAKTALPAMLDALKSKDRGVRIAAITAAGKTGGENALPALLALMKNGNSEETTAVKNAIDIMKGSGVVNQAAEAIPSMPANAKAALVTVLGERAAHDKVDLVFSLINNQDTAVSNASLNAIKSMVTREDLPKLFSLLNEASQPEGIKDIQDAIITASATIPDKSRQANIALNEMAKAPENKKPSFFNILAAIGDNESLKAVTDGFDRANAAAKSAALKALSEWSDSSAADALYKIGSETSNEDYLNLALQGYIHSINTGFYPDAQKLLMLRKAMDIAKTTLQKQTILKEAGKNGTFPALVFAGNYLDDPSLQQEAAHAVMDIALSDKKYYGKVIRDLLNKTKAVLKGTDSDYQKEAIRKYLAEMPAGEGFVSLFNGKDLSGWKGLVANPIERAKMDEKTLAKEQQKADKIMQKGWYAKDGVLNFSGEGQNICTGKKYGDFEMFVDWKITKDGDAGIYLRGSPQVQIWDTSRRDVGAEVGSGGLYNNQKNPSKPLKLADNAIGDWNNFHIIMKGGRVTVYLNGELVVDNVILENYWDRNIPIFPLEQIELQAHGTHVAYRDLYICEIPKAETFTLSEQEKKEGFKVLFDGTNLNEWTGDTAIFVMEDGDMVTRPKQGSLYGNLFTKDEYSDFDFRFEFQLTPGANNGVGIRAPLEGNAAYLGMELQIIDDGADIFKNLKPYQYHGSIYGVIPAKRGCLKPVGEWNYEEVIARGPKIKIILNGTVIVDGDIAEASENGTMDHLKHPGLKRTLGHIGFLGHASVVRFRNIRVKDLSK